MTMTQRCIILLLAMSMGLWARAQSKITISQVQAVDGQTTLQGTDATIQLGRAEGRGSATVLSSGGVEAKVQAKVSSHHVRRSSVKDSAVNVILEISMRAGKDKDTQRVEKIFYLEQSRTSVVSKTFNFKKGITMRPIALTFNIALE